MGPPAVTVANWGISLASLKENLTVLAPLPDSAELLYRLESRAEMNLFVEAAAVRRARDEKHVTLTKMRAWVGRATGKRVRARRGVPVSDQ